MRRHLEMFDTIERLAGEIDEEAAALLPPFGRQTELLDTIPGVDVATAEVISVEVGVEMSRFPAAAHRVSWAGFSSRNDESAGKCQRRPGTA